MLGFFVMSVSAALAFYFYEDDKPVPAVIFSGPVVWMIVVCGFCISKTRSWIKHKRYKALVVCPDGFIRYTESRDADRYVRKKGYYIAVWSDYAAIEGWNITNWNKKYFCRGIPNARYAPRIVWEQYDPIERNGHQYEENTNFIYQNI